MALITDDIDINDVRLSMTRAGMEIFIYLFLSAKKIH